MNINHINNFGIYIYLDNFLIRGMSENEYEEIRFEIKRLENARYCIIYLFYSK